MRCNEADGPQIPINLIFANGVSDSHDHLWAVMRGAAVTNRPRGAALHCGRGFYSQGSTLFVAGHRLSQAADVMFRSQVLLVKACFSGRAD